MVPLLLPAPESVGHGNLVHFRRVERLLDVVEFLRLYVGYHQFHEWTRLFRHEDPETAVRFHSVLADIQSAEFLGAADAKTDGFLDCQEDQSHRREREGRPGEGPQCTGGNISAAARDLGTTQRILGYRVRKLGIDYKHFRRSR